MKYLTFGFFSLVVLLMGVVLPIEPSSMAAIDCSPVALSISNSNNTSTMELSGIISVNVGMPTTSPIPNQVFILANGQRIGRAVQQSTSGYSWQMKMPAPLLPSGSYDFNAEVRFPDGQTCLSLPIQRFVNSPAQSALDIALTPLQIETPINTNVPIVASVYVKNFSINFTPYAVYNWEANSRGNINPTQASSTNFFSGPEKGNGEVRLYIRFGLSDRHLVIPTNITSPEVDNNITDDVPTSSDNNTNVADDENLDDPALSSRDDSGDASQQVSASRVAELVESNPDIQNCFVGAIGEQAYADVSQGVRRPSIQELSQLRACFAQTAYIIPANFAPVAPAEVEKLPRSTQAKIGALTVSERKLNEVNIPTLKFTGQAEPYSAIFLYIFSDPLVLTVTADERGEWTYELENPLEPGSHTAYAVVDRGDGVYEKTDPFDFVIAEASATAANPSGLSLQLESPTVATTNQSRRGLLLYLIGAAVLVTGAIVASAVFVRKQSRAKNGLKTDMEDRELLVTPDGKENQSNDQYQIRKSTEPDSITIKDQGSNEKT